MGCGASKSSAGDPAAEDKPAKAPPADGKPAEAGKPAPAESKASSASKGEPAKAASASDSSGPNLQDAKVVFLFARETTVASGDVRQATTIGTTLAESLGGTFLAVPDLLRKEIREATTLGLQLAEMIKMGKIVPPSQSVELLQRAMAGGAGPFLVEGFPKSIDNLRLWEESGGPCKAALYFSMGDSVYSEKEVAAGKAQEDVERRMRAFKAQTQPVVDALTTREILKTVELSDANDEVVEQAKKMLKDLGVEAGSAGSGNSAVGADATPAGADTASESVNVPPGKVIFVLGGPGTGKGTQCQKLVEKYGCAHFSAGDLLREEVKKGSDQGKEISDMIREGKIVPAQVTLDLLKGAMAERAGPYLIDGFPRSMDNLEAFDEQVGACSLAVFFSLTEEQMEERLLERGKTSGRSDDNIEAIKRRFRTFTSQSMPVVEALEKKGVVQKFDATKSADEVFAEVSGAYAKAVA